MSGQKFLDQKRELYPNLCRMINERFTSATETRLERTFSYTNIGCQETYTFQGAGMPFELLSGCADLIKKLDHPLRVLDIGAGACRPMVELVEKYGEDVSATAITAHAQWRYPYTKEAVEDLGVDVRIGNGDVWEAVVNTSEEFDLIVSHYGVAWFVDPLGAIERALSQLSEGGRMYVAPAGIYSDPRVSKSVVDALIKSGYVPDPSLAANYSRYLPLLGNFHVRKASQSNGPIFDDIVYDEMTYEFRRLLEDPYLDKFASVGYTALSS